jgi:phosphatidylserine decarboxylase
LLAAVGALAAGWLVFARDPARIIPQGPGLIVAPADGRVLVVERAGSPPDGAPSPAWRIVIFLSLWDVHVQRAPEAGRVTLSAQQAGGFAPAMTAAAAGNAGHWLGVETAAGPLLVLRTAGLVVRRVTTAVAPGDCLKRGQRIGRIWFGSRTEVFLPAGIRPAVQIGQQVYAGETIIAHFDGGDA